MGIFEDIRNGKTQLQTESATGTQPIANSTETRLDRKVFVEKRWEDVGEKSKPYFFRVQPPKIALIHADMSEAPKHRVVKPTKKDGRTAGTWEHPYFYLENVEIFRYVGKEEDELRIMEENLVYQFPETTRKKLRQVYMDNKDKQWLYLGVHRHGQRSAKVIVVPDSDVENFMRLPYAELKSKYFGITPEASEAPSV